MGAIKRKKTGQYRPKKKNEIKLSSYISKVKDVFRKRV